MARRRKAWLPGGSGIRFDRGKRLRGFYASWYDHMRGGKKVHRTRCFETQKAARDFVRRYNARLDLGYGETVGATIRDVIPEYASSLTTLPLETRTDYATAIGRLAAIVGEKLVSAVTGQDIDALIVRRLSGKKAVTQNTVAKDLRMVARFFTWAMASGYANYNPVKLARVRVRTRARQRPALPNDVVARIIEALDTEDRRLAAWIAMTAGLDRGVIERLTAIHLDLEHRCFVLVRPKTGVARNTPIHPALIPPLAQRMQQRPRHAPLLSGLSRQHRGKDWWALALERAGLEGIYFRDLRALATRRVQDAGGSVGDAQHLLGHADSSTTLKHYHSPDPGIAARIASLPLPGLSERTLATAATPAKSSPSES